MSYQDGGWDHHRLSSLVDDAILALFTWNAYVSIAQNWHKRSVRRMTAWLLGAGVGFLAAIPAVIITAVINSQVTHDDGSSLGDSVIGLVTLGVAFAVTVIVRIRLGRTYDRTFAAGWRPKRWRPPPGYVNVIPPQK